MNVRNWALFIEIDQVKWSFGIDESSQEFLDTTVRFIQSLQAIGRELYEQGVASIKLERPAQDLLNTHEIFIINLSDQFFFIISDLPVSVRLIHEDIIPYELMQIICAVLVGQAAILYSYLKEEETKRSYSTDDIFSSILRTIGIKHNLDDLVSDGRCSLSSLNFQELLLFHYLLRNHFENEFIIQETTKRSSSWAIMVDKDGLDIPIAYLSPKDPLILGNFLGAIYSYVQALFGVKPAVLVFGGYELIYLSFFGGKNYFLAVSNPIALFQDTMFNELCKSIPQTKWIDLVPAIKEYLVKQISAKFEHDIRKDVENLIVLDNLVVLYNQIYQQNDHSLLKPFKLLDDNNITKKTIKKF